MTGRIPLGPAFAILPLARSEIYNNIDSSDIVQSSRNTYAIPNMKILDKTFYKTNMPQIMKFKHKFYRYIV